MISAAVVAAVVGFIPATAQAAGPSTAPGTGASATTPAAGAGKGAPSAGTSARSAEDTAAEKAARDAVAKDIAAGNAAAAKAKEGARSAAPDASATSGPPAGSAEQPYFQVSTGRSNRNAHGMGMAVGVSTDLTQGVVTYQVDWGDGSTSSDVGLLSEVRFLNHTFAEVGSHKVTVTATEAISKLTALTVFEQVVDGSEFTPYSPTRLLDTRDGTGAPAAGAVAPYATARVKIAGNGDIPAGVTSVALNITATNTAVDGHVIAYASGSKQPTTSNVNFTAGQTVPTLAIVPVGADGYVELANRSGSPVDLLADVTGWFSRSAANGYTSVKPSRIGDTREGRGTAQGQVAGQSSFALQVAGQGGLPAQGVAAVALNVTVTDPKGPGHLTVSPSGLQPSATSNLNFTTGQTVANAVIVPVGPDGRISVRNGAWGAADVIVDVTGYYSADGKAAYLPEEPRRLYDSRPWGPLSGRNFNREGVWTSGRALEALVLNTTVTNPQGSGHLAVAPEPGNLGGARPTPPDSSVLNWTKGATVSNLVQADFRNVEYVDIWNLGWEPTDLIVDLVGMYDRS
ncbi:hypothetical protein J2S46_000204 [Kitasatospora herbaricolor]|uniref:PKD domain-containing protein n=1 Tax=Kitasatospora herbaricolor TaxID=68217 RepID=UPI00174A0D1B|nr:PKD domain-containing protein [Kitasatospora herbaricolor]MDQ0305648.1 hypothetical protein [Kitasatospora herbaricolor]